MLKRKKMLSKLHQACCCVAQRAVPSVTARAKDGQLEKCIA